jgi:hypothetical protein
MENLAGVDVSHTRKHRLIEEEHLCCQAPFPGGLLKGGWIRVLQEIRPGWAVTVRLLQGQRGEPPRIDPDDFAVFQDQPEPCMGGQLRTLRHVIPEKTARHPEMEPQDGSIVKGDLQEFSLSTNVVNLPSLQIRGGSKFRIVNGEDPEPLSPDFSKQLAAQRLHFRQFGHDQTPCEFKGM